MGIFLYATASWGIVVFAVEKHQPETERGFLARFERQGAGDRRLDGGQAVCQRFRGWGKDFCGDRRD